MPSPPSNLRRRLPVARAARFLFVVVGLGMILGCPPDKTHRKQQLTGKPALELRKAVSFALASKSLPASREDLVAAIVNGMRGHVKLPDRDDIVTADGDHYPALQRLKVDLTDAGVDTGKKPAKLKSDEKPQPGLRAEQFQFCAQPLNVDGGHISMDVRARQVRLGVQHDKNGGPVLVLDDARDGQVDCQTTTGDLSTIFRASANERGKPFGLSVQKAKLALESSNDRDLSADLRLASRLLLVPITLHFKAHVAVDRDGNASLSGLSCDGDDVAGTLITQFIRPSLAQYNGRTMPLVAFPSDRIRLRDVTVHVDGENVRVAATFGS